MHPSLNDLEHYVMGALDAVAAARVEAHVGECERCAAALAHEASLELAFEQVARAIELGHPAVTRTAAKRDAAARAKVAHRRTVSLACALGGALSIAAAWFLWVSPIPPDGMRTHGAPVVDVGADAETASLDAMKSAGLDGG